MSVQPQETVTLLFTDLEGSTDLRTRLGDDAAHRVIRIHEEMLRAEIRSAGGTEAKALGDGFMVLFGSARQAISCAVSIQRAIETHNADHPADAFKVRMGINTGEVTREGDDVYGTAVNACARICAKAQGGQILVSQIVKDLMGFVADIRLVDRGLYWLKGFPERARLFEVMWRDPSSPETTSDLPPAAQAVRSEVPELPRAQGPIVGRVKELSILRAEVASAAQGRLRTIAVEGEAGIGKTRLLEAALAVAAESGFTTLRVSADEDLRGPFIMFRTLFASSAMQTAAAEARSLESLERARAVISGEVDMQGLSPQEQMFKVFDEVTMAVRSLTQAGPLALLLDDLQWADEDSLKLLRYLTKTLTTTPVLMLITIRIASGSASGAVSHLISDLERMHVCRRLQLTRFTRSESAELLRHLLGRPVSSQALETLHSRAEGVPFFIEEFARAYRQTQALQLIGDTWTMTQLSGPAVPASVASLIERRLAQLDPAARQVLADAAVIGRRFKVADLHSVVTSLGEGDPPSLSEIEDLLDQGVSAGLVSELPAGSNQDFAFTHDQIAAALGSSMSRQRRKRIHAAIADTLSESSTEVGVLSALAHHSLRSGDDQRGVACAIKAASATLDAHAPEETVRIVDDARAAAASPQERAKLLRLKDDALAVLERSDDRHANLAEMAALASAIGDPAFEMEVQLRRSAAARMAGDYEMAHDLASRVRAEAAGRADRETELLACLEQGQALMHSGLGETFMPLVETDLDAASEPFERAVELARSLDDRPNLAAALRELGVLALGRMKHLAIELLGEGRSIPELSMNPALPEMMEAARGLVAESLQIYEELGDRRGAMSALIALAYVHVAKPTRRGEAGRIEQVRRLRSNLKRMTSESEQALDEAHMLYSIHVFARSHLILDLALERGREGYDAARAIGNRTLEAFNASGMALAHLSLGETVEAEAWLERMTHAALMMPSPTTSMRIETLKGLLAVAKGERDGLDHLRRAVDIAVEHRSIGARCETLALLALEAAKMGAAAQDETLLDEAVSLASEAHEAMASLKETNPELPWEAQAWAASALVAHARGDREPSIEAARAALSALSPRFMRALYMDVLWITAKVLIEGETEEESEVRKWVVENLFVTDTSIVDLDVKKRWINVPMHREVADLVGYTGFQSVAIGGSDQDLREIEVELLRQLVSGKDDAEIAQVLDAEVEDVSRMLQELYEKLGVQSRDAATTLALTEGFV